jgi:hypothetical protein
VYHGVAAALRLSTDTHRSAGVVPHFIVAQHRRRYHEERIMEQSERELKAMNLRDLGYINFHDLPEVAACKALGHKTTSWNLDWTHHGLDTAVFCKKCGYVYHIDSSD